jgi:hypothetical protein
MHLLEDALDRAHPGLKPYQLRRLAATWTADSLSDSLSLAVHIEMNVLVARVRPARGGALRGLVTYHGEAPGSPAHPPPLGEFEWRRVDCDSLALDRTYDQSELLRNPHDTRQVRRSSSQQLQVIISRSSTMSCACQR